MTKKKTFEYFEHSFYAGEDKKIKKLISKNGPAGYGTYWLILEALSRTYDGTLKADYIELQHEIGVGSDKIKNVVERFGLFKFENKFFYSPFIRKTLAKRRRKIESGDEKSKKQKEAYAKFREANGGDVEIVQRAIYEKDEDYSDVYEPDPEADALFEKVEKIVDLWNKKAPLRRKYKGFVTPGNETFRDIRESADKYSLDDFSDAFDEALSDKNFAWTLRIVCRLKNMEQLLGRKELKKDEAERNGTGTFGNDILVARFAVDDPYENKERA